MIDQVTTHHEAIPSQCNNVIIVDASFFLISHPVPVFSELGLALERHPDRGVQPVPRHSH